MTKTRRCDESKVVSISVKKVLVVQFFENYSGVPSVGTKFIQDCTCNL